MPLNPFITSSVNVSQAEAVNALRTVKVKVIAPCANTLVVGQRYTFETLDEAITILGASYTKGNVGIKIIDELYAVQDQIVVEFFYAGTNADSVTATTLNGAIVVGATSFTVTSATGLAIGDYITIDTGANQEYRKILNLVGTTVTVNKLDLDHATLVAITKITQYTIGNIDTCLTTAETVEGEVMIIDKADQKLANIKSHLTTIDEDNNIFTIAFIGYPFGKTDANIMTDAQTTNYKRMVFNFGLPVNEDGYTFEGVILGAKACASYAKKMSAQRSINRTVISMNNIVIQDCISVKDNADDHELILSENDALVNGHVTSFENKTVDGTNAWRVHKMVTSYYLDVNSLPSTIYSNIVDISGEDYMRRYIPTRTGEWMATLNISGNDLTTSEADQSKLQTFVQQELNKFEDLDGGTAFNYVTIQGVTGNQVNIKVNFKLVTSADQMVFVFSKQI